jgi:hypothetical protein
VRKYRLQVQGLLHSPPTWVDLTTQRRPEQVLPQ